MNDKMPFAVTWMDIEIIITKWSKSGKTKIPLIYGILKNDTIELIYKAEVDIESKLMVPKERWGKG